MKGMGRCRFRCCRLKPGDDSGRWCELFQDTRGALIVRSVIESDRRRFRLADSMGCIAFESKVAACLFRDDRGSSFEYDELGKGGGVNGVSLRLCETSDEESDGRSLPKHTCIPPLWFGPRACRRPF